MDINCEVFIWIQLGWLVTTSKRSIPSCSINRKLCDRPGFIYNKQLQNLVGCWITHFDVYIRANIGKTLDTPTFFVCFSFTMSIFSGFWPPSENKFFCTNVSSHLVFPSIMSFLPVLGSFGIKKIIMTWFNVFPIDSQSPKVYETKIIILVSSLC